MQKLVYTCDGGIKIKREYRSVVNDANKYLKAQNLLADLRKKYLAKKITSKQFKEIRDMAISGDIEGAFKTMIVAVDVNEEGGVRHG